MDIHGPNIIGGLQLKNGVLVNEISNSSSTDKDTALLTSSAIQTLSAASSSSWENKSSDFDVSAGGKYKVNTDSTSIIATLPSSPSDGDEFTVVDITGNFGANKLTLSRNGKKIMGLSEDMDLDTNNQFATFVYYSTNGDWRLIG